MAYSEVRLTIRMTPAYRAFLDRLREAGGYRDDAAMVETALARLAQARKIEPPPRANPVGYQGRKNPD